MSLNSLGKAHLVLLRDGLGKLEQVRRIEAQRSEDDFIVLSDEDELGPSRRMVQRRTETKIRQIKFKLNYFNSFLRKFSH